MAFVREILHGLPHVAYLARVPGCNCWLAQQCRHGTRRPLLGKPAVPPSRFAELLPAVIHDEIVTPVDVGV